MRKVFEYSSERVDLDVDFDLTDWGLGIRGFTIPGMFVLVLQIGPLMLTVKAD